MATIRLDASEYESGLNEASDKTSKFSETLQSFGTSLSNTGSSMTNNVSRPLLGIGKNMLQAGMDYEAGMDEVAAISGATGAEIEALGDKAMEMAAKTKFSTSESAEAYKYMAMAGWKTNDMLNSLSAVMYLAGASGEDLGTTSDIVTDAMTAFGMAADGSSKVLKDGYTVEVSNAQRFTDVLAAASNNANTNVSMLGDSFKYVAPVAGSMGYNIEDVALALSLMANSGVKASMSGTALRSILTNMANPTDNMAIAMDKLGVSLTDEEGKMYTLKEVLEQLRRGFGGGKIDSEEFASSMSDIQSAFDDGTMSEEEYEKALNDLMKSMYGVDAASKAELASMLAGKYAMAGLLSIVSASDEDYNKLADAIYNSNGATEKMYSVMTDNAQGAVTMLDSAINVLYTSMSQHIIPIFTEVVRKITEVVNWFGSLDDGTQKLILTIGGIAIAVGPVLTVIGNIVTAIGTISSAISGIGSVVSGVVNFVSGGITGILGIGGKLMGGIKALFALVAAHPIVAAIAAVIAIFATLWANCEEFRNFFIGLWDGLKSAVSSFVEWFKGAWNGIGEFFSNLWNGVKETFSAFGEWVSQKAGEIVDWFKEKWDGIKEFFSELWESLKEAFAAFGEWVSEKAAEIVEWFKEKWNGLVEFFGELWDGIKEVFSGVAEFFGEVFAAAAEAISAAWSAVVEFFSGVWNSIQGVFSTVAEVLGGLFQAAAEAVQAAWNAVVEFFSGVWQGIQEIFASVAEVLGGFFQAAAEAVKNAWSAIIEFFRGIWEGIKNVFSVVAEVLGGFFRAAVDAIKAVWEGISEFFQGVWEAIKEIFTVVAEVLGGFFAEAVEAVKEVWNGIIEFFQGIWDAIQEVFSNVAEFIGNTFEKAVELVKKAWNGITTFFSGVVNKIVGVFNGVKSKFLSIGKNIVGGIKSGITAAWGALKDTVGNLVGGLVDWIKGLLGIASPSKVFAGIGKYMALGMGKGWEDEFGGIKRQIESGLNFGTASIGLSGNYSGTRYGTNGDAVSAANVQAGTTVNIYSPVAVDPVQAAREWKKTTQRMAIGYV